MLADMAAQMQQLKVEKEELQGRNQLLESLLQVQQQRQQSQEGPDPAQVCTQLLWAYAQSKAISAQHSGRYSLDL